MNQPAFPQHQEQQRALREVIERLRERNAMRRAEIACLKAAGKVHTFGFPVLTGGKK